MLMGSTFAGDDDGDLFNLEQGVYCSSHKNDMGREAWLALGMPITIALMN